MDGDNKKIYEQWWFWLLVLVIVIGIPLITFIETDWQHQSVGMKKTQRVKLLSATQY